MATGAWLNYHHLLYFWAVARTGSVVEAAKELRLSPSAISSQVKSLEQALGQKLLVREGRRLVTTDIGAIAFRFADDIFRLGEEMQVVVREGPARRHVRLEVAVVDDFPPLIAERLLRSALSAVPGLRLVCRRGSLKPLLASLSAHEIDMVLTAEPVADRVRGKAHEHFLGECGVTFFGGERLATLEKGFPKSLDGAPALMPAPSSPTRALLDAWFREQGVRPAIVGEFEDQALLRTFGARGIGFFAGASVVEEEIRHFVRTSVIGRTEQIRLRFYAITLERHLRHPGVVAVTAAARDMPFS